MEPPEVMEDDEVDMEGDEVDMEGNEVNMEGDEMEVLKGDVWEKVVVAVGLSC